MVGEKVVIPWGCFRRKAPGKGKYQAADILGLGSQFVQEGKSLTVKSICHRSPELVLNQDSFITDSLGMAGRGEKKRTSIAKRQICAHSGLTYV